MHEKASFVFWTTLILYVFTVFSVSYVGVYLTYICIPIIVLSGLIMKVTKPSREPESEFVRTIKTVSDIANTAMTAIDDGLTNLERATKEWSAQVKANCEKEMNEINERRWEAWIQKNQENLKHPANFEEKFVRIVLSKIPEIDPGDLISQYPFTDQKGGSRCIDFMIINEKKGYKLPIELDGLTKFLGSDERPDYSRFIDFLRRQNALVNTFGIVLRYTNKEMFHNTAFIISEIRNTLLSQSRGEIQHRTEVEERKLIENTYREEIEKLRLQQNKEVKSLEQEINGLKGKIERQVETESQLTSKLRIYEDRIKHLQQNPITTANSVDIEALFVELRGIKESLANRESIDDDDNLEGRSHKTIIFVTITALVAGALAVTAFFYFGKGVPPPPAISHPATSIELPTADTEVSRDKEENMTMRSIQYRGNEITAYEAKQHIGEEQKICGNIVELKEFKKGIYLNFEESYPNQPASAVIWNSNKSLIRQASQLYKVYICVSGKISEYKGKPQIIINSPSQITSN